MNRPALSLLALLAVPPLLAAQSAPPAQPASRDAHAADPVAVATRTTGSIRVDGRLDDEAWAAATPVSDFTQWDPAEGTPVSERTEARILYDGEALYVGVRLWDRSPVSSRLGRRDMPLGDSDWVGLVVDSYHDHRTAFSFDLNPAGVRRDALKIGDVDDNSWDPVWEGASSVDSTGWTAEYRIPFSQLRFSPAAEQTWGIQIERVIRRNQEYSLFAFTPKKERGGIARYGHLHGLRDIRPGKRLEILPYTVAKAEYVDPAGNPFRTDSEYGVSGGLDLKYRVTSNLTLDATLNPDFGQVEVDPAVVNLSAFETFFPEKRPFFIEGTDNFNFYTGAGASALFYTRRIGRTPQLFAPGAAEELVATTILGAAKLSGKTGGWSVGLMEALTEREEVRFRPFDVEPGAPADRFVVEPLTNYLVGRARRDFRSGQTSLGAIATAVSRDLDGAALEASLRSSAYAGGADFRHEWARRSWVLSGYAAGSTISGARGVIGAAQRSSARYFQRPDAGHVELDTLATSLAGLAGELTLARQAGRHWRGSAAVTTVSPGYEINDLGFSTRSDLVRGLASVTYLENTPGPTFRNWRVQGQARLDGNYDGDHIGNTLFLGSNWLLRNYWNVAFNAGYSFESTDDRLTRGGPLARRPADGRVYVSVDSDPRKGVTGYGGFYYGEDAAGGGSIQADAGVTLRPSPRWTLSVGPAFVRNQVEAQYVASVRDDLAAATFGRRYVFADLEQTELALDTRLDLTFTPRLTLQLFAQPLISAADFGDYKELEAARTFDFAVYGRDRGTLARNDDGSFTADPDGAGPAAPFRFGQFFSQRDFNQRFLRGNAVLRWEWRPGSTLYVAWQQRRFDEDVVGDFSLNRDRSALFSARPDNVFLIKVNYWLNP
jgi:hypothetical protein